MGDSTTEGVPDHPEWEAFSARHPGSPFLGRDPLYALSEPLIEAIREEVPDFFTAEQEQFERDLARAAGFGFVMRAAYGATRDVAGAGDKRTLEERGRDTARTIDEMLGEELRQSGADEQEVEAYFKTGDSSRAWVEARQAAYAGWLVMNPAYRADVNELREKWGDAVRTLGRFPRSPTRWLTDDPEGWASVPSDLQVEFGDFYRGWGLETLVGWDYPVPMEPDLNVGLRQDAGHLSQAGMVLFVPWYLLRGEKLGLGQVARQSRLATAPDHLLEWVANRGGRKGDKLGDKRYATIRWLHRFYELALLPRYSDLCAGNLERLDIAFASVIEREEDTVKKLRRELWQALGRTGPGAAGD